MPHTHRPFITLAIVAAVFTLTACGTLTGIPAHGGGKRYAEEQRLVSASIRAALKDIDVTPLKGKRAAMVFDIVADEGGGNMAGGRINPGMLFSIGTMMSPVTSSTSAFQIFNLAEGGANYSNTSGGASNTSSTVTVSNGTGTNSGTNNSNTNGSGTNTSTTNSSGTNNSTTNGSGTNTSTTNGSGTNTSNGTSSGSNTSTGTNNSAGTNTATTGGTTTDGSFTQTGGSTGSGTNTGTNTNTGSNTNTATTNGSNTSTGTTSGTNTNTATTNGSNTSTGSTTGSNTGTSASNNTSTSTQSSGGSNDSSTAGGFSNNRQALSPTATSTQTQTKGTHKDQTFSLAYKGLGEYQNMAVPKSDATLLMGLVRNYLLFSGVTPTIPTDPKADVLLYVTVDVFGTVRSRFDALAYNNETVKAETSFEISAYDREGKMVMRPTVANREAQYREHYLLWAGPFVTTERVNQGTGLLVDFTDVDGSKTNYNEGKEDKAVNYPLGKN